MESWKLWSYDQFLIPYSPELKEGQIHQAISPCYSMSRSPPGPTMSCQTPISDLSSSSCYRPRMEENLMPFEHQMPSGGYMNLLESQGALLPQIPTSWPQMADQPMSSHTSPTEPAEPKQTQEERIKERLDRVKYRPRSMQGSVRRFENCKNISIVAPHEMYGGPWREWIEYEAILDLHIEGMIDITFIHWWTMHLYSKAKHIPDNKCSFLNPHIITSSQCRLKENEVREHIMDTKRLNPGKDIYMAHYLQGDSHWVLMVLCPNPRKGYIVDSYEYEKKNENTYYFPAIIESALDTKFDWMMVKCFQQKGGWECGYYMMKFMFDLMINKQADFPHSISDLASCSGSAAVAAGRKGVKRCCSGSAAVAACQLWDDSRRLKSLEIDQVALLALNEFYRDVVAPLDKTTPQ